MATNEPTLDLALHVGQDTGDPASVAFAIAPRGVATEDVHAHGPVIGMSPSDARDVMRLIETAADAAAAHGRDTPATSTNASWPALEEAHAGVHSWLDNAAQQTEPPSIPVARLREAQRYVAELESLLSVLANAATTWPWEAWHVDRHGAIECRECGADNGYGAGTPADLREALANFRHKADCSERTSLAVRKAGAPGRIYRG